MRPRVWLVLVGAMVACGGSGVDTTATGSPTGSPVGTTTPTGTPVPPCDPSIPGNAAPMVAFVSPQDGAQVGQQVELMATVADAQGIADVIDVRFVSDQIGVLGVVLPDGSGVVRLDATLTPVPHELVVRVTDAGCQLAQDAILVNVSP